MAAACLTGLIVLGGAAPLGLPGDTFLDGTGPLLADPAPPALQLTREDGRITLTFTGTLEAAATLAGLWNEVTNAVSPYQPETTGLQNFYRTRVPDSDGIFSARTVVPLGISAPLQTHFDLAFAGVPDGIFPPRREKPYFDGSLTVGGKMVPVSLRVRGNSSLQECPFPKLKFKVSKKDREGTPFAQAREIKIGTHCAEGGTGTIGRLRDERATFREALAFEAMELLGFTSPQVRRARIEFRDTSTPNEPNPAQWQVTRNALILEDPEVVAERLGGHALDDEELAALRDANFSEQLITDLEFLHVLFGNWDYRLSLDGVGLWNTDVIQLADGQYLPLAGDFDLASWVTEQVLLEAPPEYHPELPAVGRRARYELEQLHGRVKPEVFAAARDRFAAHRAALESHVNTAEIDAAGRTNVLQHVGAFFDALAALR